LVVEPWLERQADFSLQLEMTAKGLDLLGYTGLDNDWKGHYQGNWAALGFRRKPEIDLTRFFPEVPDIAHRVQVLYDRILQLLEDELRQMNYFGPVGIDAFVYATAEGKSRLKPIVEINPRYTMGRLTIELMRNVAPGSSGIFRLINRRTLRRDGFVDFKSWAQSFAKRFPICLEGDPVPKIREGGVCLTDPEQASVCTAVFLATRTPTRFSALSPASGREVLD
jgi:hypothetical protein